MFCIKCGSQIADGSNFCENCGSPQHSAMPQENTLEKGYEEIVQKKEDAQSSVPELELPPKTEYGLPVGNEQTAEQPKTDAAFGQASQPSEAQTLPTTETPQQQYQQPVYQNVQQQASSGAYAQGSFNPNASQQQYQSAPINNQGAVNGPYQNFYAKPKKSKKTGIIIAIVVVVLAAIAAAGFILGGGSHKKNAAYTNTNDLIQAYFKAVQSGDTDEIIALMPPGWVDTVCSVESYSDEEEFLRDYEYASNMGYMGKKIKEYYIEEDYTEYFTSSQVESVNNFYSPDTKIDNIILYYVDCRFKDGSSDEFAIYVAEVSGNYYIINTF